MAKLVLSMDGLVLKEIPLNKERISIGRKPHNDVQIDNLAISGEHAVVVTILNDSFLEDLNSTNGTYVNGQPVKKHVLHANDIIELGKYRLKYLLDSSTEGDLDPVAVQAPQAQSSTPPASENEMPVGQIQLLTGANAGKELDLVKTLTKLGKPDLQVAVITRRPDGYFITHVEGARRPLVNGKEIDVQAHALGDHDIIEVAGVKMEFFLNRASRGK